MTMQPAPEAEVTAEASQSKAEAASIKNSKPAFDANDRFVPPPKDKLIEKDMIGYTD